MSQFDQCKLRSPLSAGYPLGGFPLSSPHFNRRQLLKGAGAISAAAVLGVGRSARAAVEGVVEERKVISHEADLYHGWPTLARRANGQLLVTCSGGRQAHVCPFGRVELITSDDNGQTWTWPRVLLDSAIDDRDSGVVETAKGSLLVTTFTSLFYESILKDAEKKTGTNAWPPERLKAWQAAHARFNEKQRQADLGAWMIRSTDGGLTWSSRYDSRVNSPHGPIQLSDGRLLYAGKEMLQGGGGEGKIGVCESTDDGVTWKWLAEIMPRDGDASKDYHELHAVETSDKQLIVHIRNEGKANYGETLQSESSDGGKTWTKAHRIGVWGIPSFLLRLRDGRLVMSYGHRRKPLGNQARVSTDHGRTWSEPILLSDDGPSFDLGYPSTVELTDGSLLSVWYEVMRGNPHAVLRQARWKLKG